MIQGCISFKKPGKMAIITSTINTQVYIDLVWFDGISTILGYLMPNLVFTYISNMICKHIL